MAVPSFFTIFATNYYEHKDVTRQKMKIQMAIDTKNIFSLICVLFAVQTVPAQVIEYNGRNYLKSACTIQDSLMSFYPVDEAKVDAAGGVQAGWINIPVSHPNYPKKTKQFDPRYATHPYLTIKEVEVEDTALNQQRIDAKRQYAEYRLKVVKAVQEQAEAIRAQKGEKLTDSKQIFVFEDIMKRHGGPWSDKEIAKQKVGKNCMDAISVYLSELKKEEAALQSFLRLTDRSEILTTLIARDGYTGDGKDFGSALGLRSPISRHSDVAYNYARYAERLAMKKAEITIKNPLLADTPVTMFNPWYEGTGAAEWEWLQDIAKKGGLELYQRSFPVEEKYYKSDKYPEYKFYYQDNHNPYVCDKDGNLLGVAVNYNSPQDDPLEPTMMLYDYNHNIYNIKSESKGVQRWAYYLINKQLGINTEPGYDKAGMGMMLGIGGVGYEFELLNSLYAYRQISRAEYNYRLAQLNEKTKELEKKIDAAQKKYPSKAEMVRAEKYVEQLSSDYYNSKLLKGFHVERKNGIQVMLVKDDRSIKILKTYILDAKGQLKANYQVLEKK